MTGAWSTRDLPDLAGKVTLVTGGNSGIGYWTALHLAQAGAHVVLACRSLPKAEAAVADMRRTLPGAKLELIQLDLSSLASVRSAADSFRSRHARLDVLCNNAGIALVPKSTSADGFESHLAANFLGHFALTGLLLDRIRAAPKARVVHIGSFAHRGGRIDFDDPHFERRPYKPFAGYGQSKLAVLTFMTELDRRFRRAGIDAISVGAHPGMAATTIIDNIRKKPGRIQTAIDNWLKAHVLNSAEQGAWPSLMAATQRDARGGSYFGPSRWFEVNGPPAPGAKLAPKVRSEEDARKLWDLAERLTQVRYLD